MIRLKGDDEVLINNRHWTFPATYGLIAIIDLFFIISFSFIHAQTFQGQRQVNISELNLKLFVYQCRLLIKKNNFGKQFGPRSGPTIRLLFDILLVFLKEFFQKVNFEKNQQTTKKHEKLPSRQWVKLPKYLDT